MGGRRRHWDGVRDGRRGDRWSKEACCPNLLIERRLCHDTHDTATEAHAVYCLTLVYSTLGGAVSDGGSQVIVASCLPSRGRLRDRRISFDRMRGPLWPPKRKKPLFVPDCAKFCRSVERSAFTWAGTIVGSKNGSTHPLLLRGQSDAFFCICGVSRRKRGGRGVLLFLFQL